jgi:hypothetical protein
VKKAFESANVEICTGIPLSQFRHGSRGSRRMKIGPSPVVRLCRPYKTTALSTFFGWCGASIHQARRIAFAATAIIVIGCSEKHQDWTEDVLLDDGTIIQVKRSITFEETRSWSGDAYNAVETDAKIVFTDKLSALPTWRVPLMALVLYRDSLTNQWVIVATTTDCDVWRNRRKPMPPYWEFRLYGDGWHEAALSTSSIGRSTNLLFKNRRLSKEHISVEDRKAMQSSDEIVRMYREIWGDPNLYFCGQGDTNK